MSELIVCLPKVLPRSQWVSAARMASEINPVNHPPIERLMQLYRDLIPTPCILPC